MFDCEFHLKSKNKSTFVIEATPIDIERHFFSLDFFESESLPSIP